MNEELVRRLAMQNERIANLYTIGPVQRAEVEQFVEAIIRECAAEADKQTIYCRGIPWGKWIKDHFGVRE